MLSFIFAFLFGDLFLQSFSNLPNMKFEIILIISCLFFYIILRRRIKFSYIPLAFMLGFFYTHYYSSSILSWTLSKELEGKPVMIVGHIVSLPVVDKFGKRFEFIIDKDHTKLRLFWHAKNPMKIFAGEKWQLKVKLKRIHGLRSHGAMDFEAWAFQKGIRATGNVIESNENILLKKDYSSYPVLHFRQLLQEKIAYYPVSPWLTALIIGERNGISQFDWKVLRNTGTNHLMAIAGLHIGIMAGFIHLFSAWIWRKFSLLTLVFPASLVGGSAALVIGISYSALAGYSIPTQRACFTLLVLMTALLAKRKIDSWHAWSLALLSVLSMNPLSVLSESFWLSFLTIALIIYGMSYRLSPSGIWWKWGRVQWIIGFGLIPISLMLYQECSLISFISNCIAIPWLGFLILPFCFLSVIFLFTIPILGEGCLYLANESLNGLWLFLTWMSTLPYATWHLAILNDVILFSTIIGFILLLLPAGMPGKWIGVIWLLPLILCKPSRPVEGDFWLTVLDIGQGLGTIVQTKNHILIYDTGPSFNNHYDMGESIVLPYLRTLATTRINKLIISHGDNDHIGGANAILKSMTVNDILTSVPEKFKRPAHYCLAGNHWEWDKVKFTILYPSQYDLGLGNDSSCVLRIDNGNQSILLTGDIEKYAELRLLERMPHQLHADLIVAPHHGSKTSGLSNFIAAVQPKIVLYSTGYKNRYHFPHLSIVNSYKKINSTAFNTVDTGTMIFKLDRKNFLNKPECYRINNKKFWHD